GTRVGRARPDVELRTVALEGGAPTPVGEVGEIVCRSPAMMGGYWRDPELTKTVVDADGWLHTGDLGALDADGNLTIVGRVKEMYIRGGYNVYPGEVESALTGHPWIARTAVVGVPDPVLGEIGVAYVVLRAEATVDPDDLDAILAGVRAWCTARIADYKAPDRVVVVDELPVTAVGKLDKPVLAARWTETSADERSIRRAGGGWRHEGAPLPPAVAPGRRACPRQGDDPRRRVPLHAVRALRPHLPHRALAAAPARDQPR